MSEDFTEPIVEVAALGWFESLGWWVTHVLEISPGESRTERMIGRVC
jgi:hypothetical protein